MKTNDITLKNRFIFIFKFGSKLDILIGLEIHDFQFAEKRRQVINTSFINISILCFLKINF